MTKPTKLELEQINSRLARENEALRKQVADLEMVSRMTTIPTRRVMNHMPQWQIDRAVAMAAAREMAMKTRMTVKL